MTMGWRSETKLCRYCGKTMSAKDSRCVSNWEVRVCCTRLCGAKLRGIEGYTSDRPKTYRPEKPPGLLKDAPAWPEGLFFDSVRDTEAHVYSTHQRELAASPIGSSAAWAVRQ